MADGSGPGYHSWNAYCGQALSADASRSGRPAAVRAFERRLLELHRLAGELERIGCQAEFGRHRDGLDPVLNHLLADTVEVLDAVRGSLPAAASPPPSAPSDGAPSAIVAWVDRADAAATVCTEIRTDPAPRDRSHATLVPS